MRSRRWVVGVAILALVAGACSESAEEVGTRDTTTTTAGDGAVQPKEGDGSIVSRYAGEEWFIGKVPETATKADATKPPVKVGIMTADSGPVAALPELHAGIDAAVAFINDELGGVGGRPIETTFCEIDLSPEKSQLCARKMVDEQVSVVIGGVNLAAGDAIKVLSENEIPWISSIPINLDEMRSEWSITFSGGTPGAFAAFADHAVRETKAKKASVMYVNLDQVRIAAQDYGVKLLKRGNVEVTEVPFDLTTQDYAAVAQKAAEGNPDAILVGAADFACPKVIQALSDLQVETTVYMVGSCADRKWLDQVGIDRAVGTIFNVEGRVDQTASASADTEIYNEVMERYEPETTPRGAATVSFRATMNLWSVLREMTGEINGTTILAALKATKDHPSFDGHPFTCDGKQMPNLPSMCSPQQVLIRIDGPDAFTEVSKGWIDVPSVLKG
jgi:branched-chain amino acid transport system substrate-binding protein